MCGEAYLQSSRIAEQCEPLAPITDPVQTRLGVTTAEAMPGAACPGWYINREPFLDVIRMHRASVNNIGSARVVTGASPVQAERSSAASQLSELIDASKACWDEALAHGEKHGYRTSHATFLTPPYTIAFILSSAP